MISMFLPSMVGLSFIFLQAGLYFNDKPKIKLSEKLLFNSLYQLFFNFFVISIPIILNLVWVGLVAENIDGSLNNLINAFEGISVLGWFAYTLYLGIYIISLIARIFEFMQTGKGDI